MNGPTQTRFQRIYDEGFRVSGKLCRLLALPGSGKVGFATARAIGTKPRRNRAVRRFREGLRQAGPTPTGLDLVVQVSPHGADASFPEIVDELRDVLRRLEERWASESASS